MIQKKGGWLCPLRSKLSLEFPRSSEICKNLPVFYVVDLGKNIVQKKGGGQKYEFHN